MDRNLAAATLAAISDPERAATLAALATISDREDDR